MGRLCFFAIFDDQLCFGGNEDVFAILTILELIQMSKSNQQTPPFAKCASCLSHDSRCGGLSVRLYLGEGQGAKNQVARGK
jgi:hypothetical protein